MSLSIGQVLNNRYRIVHLLGQGGFGAVYRAWDTNLNRAVAVKENLEISEMGARQFTREASLLANLHHPGLPRVTDYFFIRGQGQYLVMDFIEGDDLHKLLEKQGVPLSEAQVLGWMSQICDALTYLHSQHPPIIHRDIKPANIKITPHGRAVLVDFGIAKVFDPRLSTTLGARALTPGYSPPEQYGRGGKTDARADIYALGATLYALLTYHQPVESLERSLGAALPSPRSLNPAISARTEAALLKAMALRCEERFQSAAEFKAALQGSAVLASAVPSQAAAPLTAQPLPAAPLRFPWAWLALALVVVCLVGGALAAMGVVAARLRLPTATQLSRPSAVPTLAADGGMPAGEQRINPADGARLVYVPAGQFTMGLTAAQAQTLLRSCSQCPINTFDNSQPAHTVRLDAFWMDLTEVTNAQYARCVAAGACSPPPSSSSPTRSDYYGNPAYDDFPVVHMTWEAAATYCRWAGGRLPTEAEWEYAARGTDGRLFPWGDQPPDVTLANTALAIGDLTAVGAYPQGASPFGLLDMAGNAWEWVADWYEPDYYTYSPEVNPQGPTASQQGWRCGRGGSYYWGEGFASVAYHDGFDPNKANAGVGFRCVIPANP